jgi:bacteriocin-like protein
MTNGKQVEREQTNQVSELTMNELECVSGGRKATGSNGATGVFFLRFQFKLVAV